MILLIVAAGIWIKGEYAKVGGKSEEVRVGRAMLAQLEADRERVLDWARRIELPKPEAGVQQIAEWLLARATELEEKTAERDRLAREHRLLKNIPTSKVFRDLAVLNLEIAILTPFVEQGTTLLSALTAARGAEAQGSACEKQLAATSAEIAANRAERERVEREHPVLARLPGSRHYAQAFALDRRHDRSLKPAQAAADKCVVQQRATVESQRRRAAGISVALRADRVDSSFDNIRRKIDEGVASRERELDDSFFHKLKTDVERALRDAVPTALAILVAVIALPVLIRALLYFVFAPLAARLAPIRIVAAADGRLGAQPELAAPEASRRSVSGVSLEVVLEPGSVLHVHPDFIQSSAVAARKRTRWLLDARYPFTSLASGLYALTTVEAQGGEPIVISSTKDPLAEVALLNIDAGSAVVLQPRSLAGVIESGAAPMHVTSHWRLGSLHAWLTLQFRYLVFHGPCSLIVKGCRGIRIEPARASRSVNQAATLGFSANLEYSNTRCDTFLAYWRGDQDLFNDRFSGPGYYIYEEAPAANRRTGMTGRGLEGIVDGVLKAFGV